MDKSKKEKAIYTLIASNTKKKLKGAPKMFVKESLMKLSEKELDFLIGRMKEMDIRVLRFFCEGFLSKCTEGLSVKRSRR